MMQHLAFDLPHLVDRQMLVEQGGQQPVGRRQIAMATTAVSTVRRAAIGPDIRGAHPDAEPGRQPVSVPKEHAGIVVDRHLRTGPTSPLPGRP